MKGKSERDISICKFLTPVWVILLLSISDNVNAQNQANHWVFGDSVGIDFNIVPPTIDTTIIISTDEPSACISDKNGNLLFYIGSSDTNQGLNGGKKYVVRNFTDSIMQNGDSLAGHTSITQGLIIIPDTYDSSKFYIFHMDYSINNFYYSVVDISQNAGLGSVISINNFLDSNLNEKMHAVKAANGKDWWIVKHTYFGNEFHLFKLDSTGIHGPFIQNFGINIDPASGSGQMIFSITGNKLLYSGGSGYTTIIDFDRCTGLLSNEIIIDHPTGNSSPNYGCSISQSNHYAYLSAFESLWQFDLTAANIAASKTLIWTVGNNIRVIGQLMLASNNKIYLANEKKIGGFDSLCTYLSVINDPDNPGLSCNFTPYSFSLNGRTSTLNLPNMPNYNLGVMENVNCDSILASVELPQHSTKAAISVFPNPSSGFFSFEIGGKNKIHSLEITNLTGELIFVGTSSEIDLSHFPSGIYFYRVVDDKDRWYFGKLVKE